MLRYLLAAWLGGNVVAFQAPRRPPFGRLSPARVAASGEDVVPGVLSVRLPKPLGLVLEEVSEAEAEGVFVAQMDPLGNAAKDGRVQEGMFLLAVDGADVAKASFDDVMDRLVGAGEELELQFRPMAAQQPEAAAAAEVAEVAGPAEQPAAPAAEEEKEKEKEKESGPVVVMIDGEKRVEVESGELLRTALLENKVDIYDFMGKVQRIASSSSDSANALMKVVAQQVSNCGGVGQCGTCGVEIIASSEGWCQLQSTRKGCSPTALTMLSAERNPVGADGCRAPKAQEEAGDLEVELPSRGGGSRRDPGHNKAVDQVMRSVGWPVLATSHVQATSSTTPHRLAGTQRLCRVRARARARAKASNDCHNPHCLPT
eukprot:scaffold895_cov315-Pinguiococcus_pyrenoidosus.AAC.1